MEELKYQVKGLQEYSEKEGASQNEQHILFERL